MRLQSADLTLPPPALIAILEAHRAGLLNRQHWLPNLAAGLTVGVVALPLAMAFAIASGAKPEQGIYTAIVAGLVVSLFGGSRLQIAGPTGAFIVVLSGITATHGFAGLQVATLLAGLIMLLLGLARLGNIIKFIPEPVIAGFTAGIGIIIWVGQWPHFLVCLYQPVRISMKNSGNCCNPCHSSIYPPRSRQWLHYW